MKRVLFFTTIIVFGCFCLNYSSKITNAAEFKPVDFHNYPVKEDKYTNIKIPQPKHVYTQVSTSNDTKQVLSGNKNNSKSTKNAKNKPTRSVNHTSSKSSVKTKNLGSAIPTWVYENTTPSDAYYNVINSNSIFFSAPDCANGRAKSDIIKKAVSAAGIGSKYQNKTELKPNGSVTIATCNRTYKDGICTRSKNEPVQKCKCAVHYLLDNCRSSVCIINAKEKRMIKIGLNNQEILEKKLKEVKELW